MSNGVKIHFRCPSCDRHLMAKPHRAGRSYNCPFCDAQVTVPPPSPEVLADWRRRERQARRERRRRRRAALAAQVENVVQAEGTAQQEPASLDDVALAEVSAGAAEPKRDEPFEPVAGDDADQEPAIVQSDASERGEVAEAPLDEESPLEIAPAAGAVSDAKLSRLLDRLSEVERLTEQAKLYGIISACGIAAVGLIGLLLWIVLLVIVVGLQLVATG